MHLTIANNSWQSFPTNSKANADNHSVIALLESINRVVYDTGANG